jgi:hypothetical protein
LTRRAHLEHPADVINQTPPELTAGYAAFRRERRAADVLNPGYVLAFAAFRDPELGLNAELSRLVRAADGTAVYLVPGDDVVAIIQRGGSGSVLGLSQALDGTGISTSFRGTGRLQIVGLLPDDVHMVTVARRNGDEIDVRVPDHLFSGLRRRTRPENPLGERGGPWPTRVHDGRMSHEAPAPRRCGAAAVTRAIKERPRVVTAMALGLELGDSVRRHLCNPHRIVATLCAVQVAVRAGRLGELRCVALSSADGGEHGC